MNHSSNSTTATDEQHHKCGLFALLPEPKEDGLHKYAATTTKSQQSCPAKTLQKSLPIKQHLLKKPKSPIRQIIPDLSKAKISASTSNSTTYNSDSDDEEYEQMLGTVLIEQAKLDDVENGNNNDEEDKVMVEGPVKPLITNKDMQQRPKKPVESEPLILVNKPLLGIDYGSDSDEEEEEGDKAGSPDKVDFFGLADSSSPLSAKRPKFEEKTPMQMETEPAIFFDNLAPGPARPSKPAIKIQKSNGVSDSSDINYNGPPIRAISDQEASKMIYEKELAPYGVSSSLADNAVSGIIDVSVDAALGPNVRENLLRNLNSKQMAQIALGPLPKVSKGEADKLAKRKHQITHLAQVAVSREEELQEKWSESKLNKKMSRQKYGF